MYHVGQKSIYIATIITIIIALGFNISYSGPGDCSNFKKYKIPNSGWVNSKPSFVNKQNAPVYRDDDSFDIISQLSFQQKVTIHHSNNNRLKIDTGEIIGWMATTDLLCADKPLREPLENGQEGLEQKFVVITETMKRTQDTKKYKVIAYPGPNATDCHSRCKELSRFTSYFIFDKQDNRVLLSPYYRLTTKYPLMGWVDINNGFNWNSALGIRPIEKVYLYRSKDDALKKKGGIPFLGGVQWYKWDQRIPIIGNTSDDKFHEIIVPIAGVGIKRDSNNKVYIPSTSTRTTIDYDQFVNDPDQFTNPDKGIKQLTYKTDNIDIFFLIDGTRSMGPSMNKVIQVVKTISKRIFYSDCKKCTRRFGFGIYRDDYAGEKNLGDWYSLPFNCDINHRQMKRNLENFLDHLPKCNTITYSDSDDYEENLFGGINKTIKELSKCPDRLKVLYVIGDHGDRDDKQSITMATIVDGLKNNVLVHFIQVNTSEKIRNADFNNVTISEETRRRSQRSYDRAYALYKKQAIDILTAINANRKNAKIGQQFHYLKEDDLVDNIMKKLNEYIYNSPKVGKEISTRLIAGESLVDVIAKLQQYDEFRNLPGLYWDIILETGCKDLGTQCTESVMDVTFKGYIRKDSKIEYDVWCAGENLSKYLQVLKGITDVSKSNSGDALRTEMIKGVSLTLEKVLGKPPYTATGESMRTYLSRNTLLPVRIDSPLFQYSIDELGDRNSVRDCVIENLNGWVNNICKILQIVYTDNHSKPGFTTISKKGNRCMGAQDIPYIVPNSIQPITFTDNQSENKLMSYSHTLHKTTFYWIPNQFLP
jgi:hypothetical protein